LRKKTPEILSMMRLSKRPSTVVIVPDDNPTNARERDEAE